MGEVGTAAEDGTSALASSLDGRRALGRERRGPGETSFTGNASFSGSDSRSHPARPGGYRCCRSWRLLTWRQGLNVSRASLPRACV